MNNDLIKSKGPTRRAFLQQVSAIGAGLTLHAAVQAKSIRQLPFFEDAAATLKININGKIKSIAVDNRTTLLDALRENLKLTGTKKGCDRGQCGACTVLLDGRRVNSCLVLAVMCDGSSVTSIEGLGTPEDLHPMQAAFLKHDAFQCGYCTPGQICSAVGLIKERHAHTDEEIKESMSGNLCRCGAYQNILSAVKEVQANTH